MEELAVTIASLVPVQYWAVGTGCFGFLWVASEVIGINPKWKSNSVVQLLGTGAKKVLEALIKRKPKE